jgi:DNA-binding GntR family transcriptional regulator
MKTVANPRRRAARGATTSRSSDSAIPYRTIAERVADWIRQRIFCRELAPGTLLREARIARELQTSRAPVREAITQLVQEGWATKRPNQSARIIAPNETMLREAATLRNVLEGYAATLAIDRLDEKVCRRLADIVNGMRRAVTKGHFSRAFELDYAFHDAVMRAAGHQMLHEMWARMGMHVRLLISGTNVLDRDLRRTVALHRRILTAFRQRDVVSAQQLMGTPPQDFEQLLARVVPDAAGRHGAGRTSGRGEADARKGGPQDVTVSAARCAHSSQGPARRCRSR